jgi:carbamoylphosphate synthase large subunit
LPLKAAGVKIIGTSPESIDLAEDRKHFNKLLEDLQIPQAPGVMATSMEEALRARIASDIPCWCGLPTCWADAPW